MKTRVLTLWLAVSAALLLSACGTDDLNQQDFTIKFSPRDLPADTAYIRFYVLRANLLAGGAIDCDTFFNDTDRKRVSEYSNDIIDTKTINFAETDEGVVVIKDLNEAAYVFYVEALASNYNILTCGCGEGEIVKGEKINIPIRLVDDCL